MTDSSTEIEKMLRDEIAVLRDRLQNVRYEADTKLEDRIEELEGEKKVLETAIKARVENIQPGDVFLIDSQEVMRTMNHQEMMKIAQRFGCTFFVMSELEHLTKMTEVELEKHNLKRLSPEERVTGLQKLNGLLSDIEQTKVRVQLDNDGMGALETMEVSIKAAIRAFEDFSRVIKKKYGIDKSKEI